MTERVAVIGASGAIGHAFVTQLAARPEVEKIYAFSRSEAVYDGAAVETHPIDIEEEASIATAAQVTSAGGALDLVVVAVGMLHGAAVQPEKALKELDGDAFAKVFAVNTTGPALVAKHFLPLLPREKRGVFAALSARVGSISDNRLGGWYAYRASKAALNMVIKNAGIEMARRYPQAVVVGLHPGTVDSGLSKPFQAHVPEGKLFTPDYAVAQLLTVLDGLGPGDSGKLFAWDGQEVLP